MRPCKRGGDGDSQPQGPGAEREGAQGAAEGAGFARVGWEVQAGVWEKSQGDAGLAAKDEELQAGPQHGI